MTTKNYCESNGQIYRCLCKGIPTDEIGCEYFEAKKGKPDFCWWYFPQYKRCGNPKAQIESDK